MSIRPDGLFRSCLPETFDVAAREIPPVKPMSFLEDGDRIALGERTLEVIHTPGYSPGSIRLYDKKNRILFTADAFFPGLILKELDAPPAKLSACGRRTSSDLDIQTSCSALHLFIHDEARVLYFFTFTG